MYLVRVGLHGQRGEVVLDELVEGGLHGERARDGDELVGLNER